MIPRGVHQAGKRGKGSGVGRSVLLGCACGLGGPAADEAAVAQSLDHGLELLGPDVFLDSDDRQECVDLRHFTLVGREVPLCRLRVRNKLVFHVRHAPSVGDGRTRRKVMLPIMTGIRLPQHVGAHVLPHARKHA
jgi:hypothetical protein